MNDTSFTCVTYVDFTLVVCSALLHVYVYVPRVCLIGVYYMYEL